MLKKYKFLMICGALFLVIFLILLLYFLPSKNVRNQVCKSITDAYQVMVSIGQFESSDGTTTSLDESYINKIINEFNKKVDNSFSNDFSSKEYYKWLNEDYLTRTYKTTIDYIVKSGVENVEIPFIFYRPSRKEITAHGELISWNLWVSASDGKYRISYAYGKIPLDVLLTQEDNVWKIAKMEGIKGEETNIQDTGILEKAEKKKKEGSLSEEKQKILKKIHSTDEICNKEYSTFSEALRAAKQIEFDDFNSYALE